MEVMENEVVRRVAVSSITGLGQWEPTQLAAMKDRLDVIVVGIKHKGCIVGGMVFAVKPRCAVVAASGGEGSGVERLHGGLIARDEGNMCVASGGGTYGKSEVIRAGDAKAKAVRGVTEQTIT